jgi:hypothetical protein
MLSGIAQNSAELCGIPYYGIRRIPRNFAEFRYIWYKEIQLKFNFIICTVQASVIGWGEGEMTQFKGIV